MTNALPSPPSELREQLALLMFPRIGSNLPPVSTVTEDADRIQAMLQELPLGGLCLFNGAWESTPATLERLRAASATPLLVVSDLERGAGQQITGLTEFPHAMAIGNCGPRSAEFAREVGRFTGEQANATGIDVVLGPVADVNSDPRNPIIATRALGTDGQSVGQLAAAFVEGCQSTGSICVAKHFPGHGNTHEDSHEMLPTVKSTRDELLATDVAPYQPLFDAGCLGVMTAHVSYPSLDASGAPATVSAPILRDLLRAELGFEGVVMSDSLLMSGVKDRFPDETSLAMACLLGGIDILLDPADPIATVAGLVQRVESGDLPVEVVKAAAERVWKWQQRRAAVSPSESSSRESLSLQLAANLSADVAKHGIVEFSSTGKFATSDGSSDSRWGVLVVRPHKFPWEPPEQPVVSALRERLSCEVIDWDWAGDWDEAAVAALVKAAKECDRFVIAAIVKPAAWHRFGLMPTQVETIKRLIDESPDNTALVSLGVPTVLDDFAGAGLSVCAFSDVAASQKAAAERLVGG